MDWYTLFSDDFRNHLRTALCNYNAESCGILSGFNNGEAIGELSEAMIKVICEAIEDYWPLQLQDGIKPLRIHDAIRSLGLNNRNSPFVKTIEDTLSASRDRIVFDDSSLEKLMTRVKDRNSVDNLPKYQFIKKGMWHIRYEGKDTYLESNLKGPLYISYLLQNQGREIHVAQMLADIAKDSRLFSASNAGELITSDILEEYRQKLEDLKFERTEQANNPKRLQEIDEETDQIASYLAPMLGLNGKPRKACDDVARIRKAIAKTISTALEKIEDTSLKLHLENSIKTHTFMSYAPERYIEWIV